MSVAEGTAAAQQLQPDPTADDCERVIELDDGRVLHIAENSALENEAGCTVWDCGLVLSHYLAKQHEMGVLNLAGQRVIELGSGTGIVGLTAAVLGAKHVTLTDRPQLLPHLQHNIQRNHLQGAADAQALEWGQPLPTHLQPPYDLIMCSDVVYSPASVRLLLSTLDQLTGPDSLILYSCEFREGAGLELLHQLLPEYQLKEQLVPYTDLHEEWCSPDILVWRIKKTSDQPAGVAAAGDLQQQGL